MEGKSKKVCLNCGHDVFEGGFLSGHKSPLYYISGKPGLKEQLFGKKKRVSLKVCKGCGHAEIFCSLK